MSRLLPDDIVDEAILTRYLESERGRLAEIERRRVERNAMLSGMRALNYPTEQIDTAATDSVPAVVDATEPVDVARIRTDIETERTREAEEGATEETTPTR